MLKKSALAKDLEAVLNQDLPTDLNEADVKKQLMDHEFQINMRLKQMDLDSANSRDAKREDRQDRRMVMSGKQQKDLMVEREAIKEKPFESAGNDVVGGGMRLGAFEPK